MNEEIRQSSNSGGYAVAADEDGVVEGAAERVRSNNNNVGDFTCGELETTMGPREEENPSSKIINNETVETAVMVEDEAAAKDKTAASLDGRDVIGDANPDNEPSDDDAEDHHGTDAAEELLLISENVEDLPSKSTEDVVATSDDYMSDTTEEYTMSSVDPHVNVDVKADSIQTDQTEEKANSNQTSHGVREADDIAVIDESTRKANKIQSERELGNLEDDAINPLGKDKDVPVDNDEEMAYHSVNVDDMMKEVPEDQRPTRRRYLFMLAACIVALAIATAVIVTSMGQDGTEETLSSSSSTVSTTTPIMEGDKGIDGVPSSLIPNLSGNTQEPSSTQPSFDPSSKPSSQYQWLQLAIDNYADTVQNDTSQPSKITLEPSSKPTANTTPPPSNARPTTSNPTTKLTTRPTSSNPTTEPTTRPTSSTPTPRPTMYPTTDNPTSRPSSANPTPRPTMHPTTASPTPRPSSANPTPRPTMHPTTGMPTTSNPTSRPTMHPSTASPTMKPLNVVELSIDEAIRPTPQQRKGCITNSIYDEIDRDIGQLKNGISDDKTKAHFLGGIVRLVAHDFMDFDRNDANNPMGPDGCFDPSHAANAGLPDDIWCEGCRLTNLYASKYSEISRADFWIACANAVIRQTSVDNGLDLRGTFEWGRVDANSCSGQGDRIPSPRGCSQTQDTFLTRMGLTWTDATALMGAHTLGRGDRSFSGHHGTWAANDVEAMIFDKSYYEEVFLNSWRPRNIGTQSEDWTIAAGIGVDRLMLNTDLCLVMSIEGNMPCCTGTRCTGLSRRCPRLPDNHPRSEAYDAFEEYLGGSYPNDNQVPFYNAFREAWRKATKVGQNILFPLSDNCDVELI